ncbi:hypothetical protein ACWOBE_02165 [Hutsoniella sourekii]
MENIEFCYSAFVYTRMEPQLIKISVAGNYDYAHYLKFEDEGDCIAFQRGIHKFADQIEKHSFIRQSVLISDFIKDNPLGLAYDITTYPEYGWDEE